MSRQRSHLVEEGEAGERLDVLLAALGCYPSRSAAARAVEEGRVCVNGEPSAKKRALRAGDTIVYEEEEPAAAGPLVPQPIELDIRYEDEDLIVLSKQAGLVCHPALEHEDGTLVNALLYHCGAEHLCNVQGEDDRLGIVHRLDRDTTGLMIAAKSDEAGRILMDDIRDRAVDRRYLALVHGVMAPQTGMVDAPLARDAKDRTRMAVRATPSSREAVTTIRVLERFEPGPHDEGYTLVECKLFTGRTHQIRVHMEFAKHPVVGDPVYDSGAPKRPEASLGLTRQFLHSAMLSFSHPMSGEELSFRDGLPEDLQEVLDALAPRSRGRTEAGEEVFEQLKEAPRPSARPYLGASEGFDCQLW